MEILTCVGSPQRQVLRKCFENKRKEIDSIETLIFVGTFSILQSVILRVFSDYRRGRWES